MQETMPLSHSLIPALCFAAGKQYLHVRLVLLLTLRLFHRHECSMQEQIHQCRNTPRHPKLWKASPIG
jgi:hypothetical protein